MTTNTVPNSEVQKRIDILKSDLEKDINLAAKMARIDHWTSVILMVLALLASAVAGVGGMTGAFSAKVTGAIALVPGILGLFAKTLKLEGKSGWFYRKRNRLKDLRDQLLPSGSAWTRWEWRNELLIHGRAEGEEHLFLELEERRRRKLLWSGD